jgi:hypothetical protein
MGGLGAVLLCGFGSSACLRRAEPYWIEAHGHVSANDIAASSLGVFGLSAQHRLLSYPRAWAAPWTTENDGALAAIAASGEQLVGLTTDRALVRLRPRHADLAVLGTAGVSKVALGDDDHLLVLADGHLRRVDGSQLSELPCSSLLSTDLAAVGNLSWVVADERLYRDDGQRCEQLRDAPAHLAGVAASSALLGVVDVDGIASIRGKGGWQRLPEPRRYRVDAIAARTRIQKLSISETTTWALDREGSVFLLSEQPQ